MGKVPKILTLHRFNNHTIRMKKVKQNNVNTFDIGQMLQKIVKEKNLTMAQLARKMGRNHTTIKRQLNNKSIQTYLIWEFSLALKYNLFQDLSALLMSQPGATETLVNGNLSDKARIAELEKENAALREERDYLKKMIDIFSKK